MNKKLLPPFSGYQDKSIPFICLLSGTMTHIFTKNHIKHSHGAKLNLQVKLSAQFLMS
jgi:hypothetical protein